MLVLQRKVNERIRIGENITIMVTKIEGGKVAIGIQCPRSIPIVRGEMIKTKANEPKDKTDESAP